MTRFPSSAWGLALVVGCGSPAPPAPTDPEPAPGIRPSSPEPVDPDRIGLVVDDLATLALLDGGGTGPWSLNAVLARSMGDPAAPAATTGVGFCTPTCFLFQLRLDGHPVPVSAPPP